MRSLLTFGFVSLLSFVPLKAQIITYDTTVDFTGAAGITGTIPSVNGTNSFFQTFAGVGGFDSATFRFIATDNTFGAVGNILFSIGEWDSSTNSIAAGEDVGLVSVPAGSSWTATSDPGFYYFDFTADLSGITEIEGSPFSGDLTYAFNIFFTSAYPFRLASATSPFALGTGYYYDGSSTVAYGDSFAFVVDAITPIPEAGTAAVLFTGLFVGFMALRRKPRTLVPAA